MQLVHVLRLPFPWLFVSLLESSLLQISSCRNTAHVSAAHTVFFPAVFYFVLSHLKNESTFTLLKHSIHSAIEHLSYCRSHIHKFFCARFRTVSSFLLWMPCSYFPTQWIYIVIYYLIFNWMKSVFPPLIWKFCFFKLTVYWILPLIIAFLGPKSNYKIMGPITLLGSR